jgi:hypothetical protein
VTTGRFDVVVVGSRVRGSQALGDLAHAVARVLGLAPGAVQRGLENGELVVHEGLSKTQAVLAARTVQQLGAIVDVRPARSDEPDEAPPVPRRPPAEVAPDPAAGQLLDPDAPVLDLGAPPMPSRFAVGPPSPPKLELDFAAAGLSAPPPSPMVSRSSPTGTSALHPHASGRSPSPRPLAEGLIVEDRIASALFGAAIAATIGMLVAFALARGDARALAERLEPELADAVADPVGVEAGRRRAPATIVAEIDDGLADVRTKYLTIWAVIALPLAAAAAWLKRPNRSA